MRQDVFAYDPVVFELQQMLRRVALESDNKITLLLPDGIFGRETARAVLEFQSSFGLPGTGEVDEDTWNAIANEYVRINEANPPALALSFRLPAEGTGDSGVYVAVLQVALSDISGRYGNLPDITVTGEYDQPTAECVSMLQSIGGLPSNGEVDVPTWNLIVKLWETKKPQPKQRKDRA